MCSRSCAGAGKKRRSAGPRPPPAGAPTRFELIGSGCSWLGPDWRLASRHRIARARPGSWISNSVVDLAEWSYRRRGLRLTRSALLLRGRQLALLGEQVEGKDLPGRPLDPEFGLPPGVTAEPIAESRGLLLRSSSGRATAQVLPVALPALPYETDRGQFASGRHSQITLNAPRGRRCWLPLVVSWDPRRNRKRLSWRVLTVSEDVEGLPARRCLRRPGELGTRRDPGPLPQPRSPCPTFISRPPDEGPVPGRQVHRTRARRAARERGLRRGFGDRSGVQPDQNRSVRGLERIAESDKAM